MGRVGHNWWVGRWVGPRVGCVRWEGGGGLGGGPAQPKLSFWGGGGGQREVEGWGARGL